MAIDIRPFMNFAGLPIQETGQGNMVRDLLAAYRAGGEPRRMQQEESKQQQLVRELLLNNQAAQVKNRYQIPEIEADLSLKQAQAENQRNFGGLSMLSGPAREIASYEIAKNMYGEDDPRTEMIKSMLDESLKHQKNLNQYYETQNETAGYRHGTKFAKELQEQELVNQGLTPNVVNPQPLSPEAQKRTKGQYELNLLKQTTDSFTRRALEQSINVDKTLKRINVDDLTRYSGAPGFIKKKFEEGKGIYSKESEEFKKYHESATAAKSLAKQVRQLLGDSVTATAQEALDALANPSAIAISPDVAKRKFNQYVKILHDEIKTFQDSAKSAAPFYGEESSLPNSLNGDMITLIHKGKPYQVPIEEAEGFKEWSRKNQNER